MNSKFILTNFTSTGNKYKKYGQKFIHAFKTSTLSNTRMFTQLNIVCSIKKSHSAQNFIQTYSLTYYFKAGTATFKLGSPFLNCWKLNFYELAMNFIWRKTVFYKEFYNRTILNFIHFKGYRQHSCFRQLYKTNYLTEWLAISHGCLWHMYQLRKKILPIVLPCMVEAENFSDHPHT
jgi:hypothetical protein